MQITKNNLLLIAIIIVANIFIFWNLPRTFYQQDEWVTLGHHLSRGFGFVVYDLTPIDILFGEGRVLTKISDYILISGFKFNVIPVSIFAILIHITNAVLVFILTKRISNNKIIAFSASLFFSANSVSHQAITWVAAFGSLPATTLILISIILYFKFLHNENRKYLYLSFLTGLFSLSFKEVGVFLFILLPAIYVFYKKNINLKKMVSLHLPLLIYGALLLTFRFVELFLNTQKVAGFVQGGSNFIENALLHFFLYPITSLFQAFVPPLDLYSVTSTIATMQYKFLVGSPLKDLVAQSIVADMISVLGATLILILLLFAAYKMRDKITNKNIIFALAFFFLSFLPYVVIHRESSYLSSRYFYVGAVGAGILFGYVVYFLSYLNKYSKWIIFPLVFLFLFHHSSIVRQDINYQVSLGEQRKAVLRGIKDIYPNLEKKSIFYVTSDKKYYGEVTNPFQNGLGYVLEVWYYDSGKIPKEFLEENFLWDLGAEGYRYKGDLGFGYYQDIDKMVMDMKKNEISLKAVKAFYLRSSVNQIIDITPEITSRVSTISGILK